ncbi:NlpC/P60 family protein [Microbacterium sp. LjRoot45]|uniref:NlpC/P60 family protein n=1 Tax=Microbacterium sp. LjRoot45 TaxID=3342329 RepID=UPI003ECE83A2
MTPVAPTLVSALGRIDDIQQRIRTLSVDAAVPATTGETASATSSTAAAFATAVKDAGAVGAVPALPSGPVDGGDIVAQAKSYLGVPYVFGGEDRSGMDCSGLVQRVLADLGIDAPRVVQDQADIGVEVPSLADAQPGDLLVTKGEGHIVIYAGDGMVIHAPSPGKVVEYRNNWLKDADLATIRRVVPPPGQSASGQAASVQAATAAVTPSGAPTLAATLSAVAAASGSSSGSVTQAAASQLLASVAPLLTSGSGSGGAAAGVASLAAVALRELGTTATTATGTTATGTTATGGADLLPGLTNPALAGTAAPAAAATVSAPAAVAAPAAPAPPLTQQLAAPVASLVRGGDGQHTLTLRVSPDDLGPVTVKARISGGSISVELASGTAAGRDALRSLLVDLRRDLAVLMPHSSIAVTAADAGRDGTTLSSTLGTASGTLAGAGGGSTGPGPGQSGPGQNGSGQNGSGHSGSDRTASRDAEAPVALAASVSATPDPTSTAGTGVDLYA